MKQATLFSLIAILLCAVMCTQQDKAAEQNKASILKANEELLNKGNLDFADEVFTADYAGSGPQAIKAFVGKLREAFPDLQVTVDPLIAEGNMVAWKRSHSGTHQGSFMGFPPSGKKLNWEAFIISRYDANGKVAEEWGSDNLHEVLQQESTGAGDPAEIIAAEKGLVAALNKGDAQAYFSYLRSDHDLFLPESGTLIKSDQKQLEADFAKGFKLDIDHTNLKVRFYGNGVALVTGFETGKSTQPDGSSLEGNRKFTSVWVKEDNAWKAVHAHVSPPYK